MNPARVVLIETAGGNNAVKVWMKRRFCPHVWSMLRNPIRLRDAWGRLQFQAVSGWCGRADRRAAACSGE